VEESTTERADMSCHIILLYLCNAWLRYVLLFFFYDLQKVMVMHQNPKSATFHQNQVRMKKLSLVAELAAE